MAGRGGYSPPSHPSKSATGTVCNYYACMCKYSYLCIYYKIIQNSGKSLGGKIGELNVIC